MNASQGVSFNLVGKKNFGDALKVNTLHGAYASHEESSKGSITVGKLADFVVLSDDPHTVSPATMKDITIVRTVVGGMTMYRA